MMQRRFSKSQNKVQLTLNAWCFFDRSLLEFWYPFCLLADLALAEFVVVSKTTTTTTSVTEILTIRITISFFR